MDKRLMAFALGDVFEIYSPKKRFNANTVQFGGKYPYVARGSSNNGIRGYITEDVQYLSPAKSLSFGQDTATVFYQPDAYFTGDKIKVMVLRNHELNDKLAQYFITVITKAFSTFAWGQSSFNEKILKATKIVLPVAESSDPAHVYTPDDIDWEYMRERIAELERERIAELDAYLKATGLDDYELTAEDKYILSLTPTTIPSETGTVRTDSEDGDERFGEFKVGELFEILNNPQLDKCNFAFGHGVGYEYPYFTRTENNNGILGYVKYLDEEHKLPGGSLAVGMISMRFHYMSHDFYAGQFTKTLVPKFGHMNDVVAQYFIALLNKHSAYYQSYLVREFSRRVADTVLALPITPTGEPDFDFMERYIRAVEKLTIAGVVQYKDRVIETTKGIVNGTAIETN